MHKSGPTIETNNYRPILILPILSKVLERFVHSCYSDYLTEFKLFTIAQSGFKKLHSTVTSLVHITDRWLSNIDKGLVTGVVFIDLCKAVDIVNINILFLKLTRYGISGSEDMESVVLLVLMVSYLIPFLLPLVFKELGWLLLENRRCMHKCTIVFKCRNGLAPPYRIDIFNVNILIIATAQEIHLNSEYPYLGLNIII